ncbi:MAG: hypothetical protein GWP11_01645 [Proteobacteria bacterium]|nr:hypothetical protein [Pseudomonadota bacterium]
MAGEAADKAGGGLTRLGGLIQATNIPKQFRDVDFSGLFSNPWFLVPFIALIGYQVYKQAFRDLFIVVLIIGIWYLSGTEYMQTLIVNGELQINKVLPVVFGGAAVLGLIIYLFFGRSQ